MAIRNDPQAVSGRKIAEKELAQIPTGADEAQGARGRVETAGERQQTSSGGRIMGHHLAGRHTAQHRGEIDESLAQDSELLVGKDRVYSAGAQTKQRIGVWKPDRDGCAIDLPMQRSFIHNVAILRIGPKCRLQTTLRLAPASFLRRANLAEKFFSFLRGEAGQISPAHRGVANGDARTDLVVDQNDRRSFATLQVNHAQPVGRSQGHCASKSVGDRLHIGLGDLGDVLAGDDGVAETENRYPQAHLFIEWRKGQQSLPHQCVAQSPNGGLRQLDHGRDFHGPQFGLGRSEALQNFDAPP